MPRSSPSVASRRSRNRGSVVIAVLIMAMMIVTTVTLYLRNAVQEMKYAERTFAMQQCVNLAEMGAEQAFWSLNNDNWSEWTELAADRFYRTYIPEDGENPIYVYVDKSDESDVWLASGSEIDVTGGSIEKQLFIRLGKRSMFGNGLMAKEHIILDGSQINIDSYNSDAGAYHVTNNRGDKGAVASVSMALGSVVVQNADILGYVATGGSAPQVGMFGTIKGFDTADSIKVDPTRVSTDFYANIPDVSMPSTTGAKTSLGPSFLGSLFLGALGSSDTYDLNSLNIKESLSLFVLGEVGIVLDTDLTIGGNLVVLPGASLTLYLNGDANITGLGLVNLSGKPENLLIYGTASEGESQDINLLGLISTSAVIYAPNADITMKSILGIEGIYLGSIVAKNITIEGKYSFHYDEALKDFSPTNTYRMLEWSEIITSSDHFPLKEPNQLALHTP